MSLILVLIAAFGLYFMLTWTNLAVVSLLALLVFSPVFRFMFVVACVGIVGYFLHVNAYLWQ